MGARETMEPAVDAFAIALQKASRAADNTVTNYRRDLLAFRGFLLERAARALAVDLGPEGITVNCICPGPIRTALTDAIPEEHKTNFAKRRTALNGGLTIRNVTERTKSICSTWFW
jgi:enoyl-[acyl-carrier-protein] reductase (NADH)